MEWKSSKRMQNKKIRNLFYLCQHLNLKICLNYNKKISCWKKMKAMHVNPKHLLQLLSVIIITMKSQILLKLAVAIENE